jgi:spoIIIJ-associated protein
MTDHLDFEGKNVEQAIEKACEELQLAKDQLSYDIISYGSTGIFGLVRNKKALIRVHTPAGPSPSFQSDDESEGYAPGDESFAADDDRAAIDALVDEAFGTPPAAESEAAPAEALSDTRDQEFAANFAPASEEAVSIARDLIKQILSVLSPEAELNVQHETELCRIHISGGESAVLIGRKGQTLEAVQYLLDKIINKQCGRGYRIIVDVEGYLETRRSELREMAASMAEKAQRTGKPATINRMNAHDRRIIHLALKNNKSVRTQSVGDGYYRKLIVLPKRRKRMPKTKSRSRQS